MTITSKLTSLLKDETGATAIEYGLVAGFISIAMISSIPAVNGYIWAAYQAVAHAFMSIPT